MWENIYYQASRICIDKLCTSLYSDWYSAGELNLVPSQGAAPELQPCSWFGWFGGGGFWVLCMPILEGVSLNCSGSDLTVLSAQLNSPALCSQVAGVLGFSHQALLSLALVFWPKKMCALMCALKNKRKQNKNSVNKCLSLGAYILLVTQDVIGNCAHITTFPGYH